MLKNNKKTEKYAIFFDKGLVGICWYALGSWKAHFKTTMSKFITEKLQNKNVVQQINGILEQFGVVCCTIYTYCKMIKIRNGTCGILLVCGHT